MTKIKFNFVRLVNHGVGIISDMVGTVGTMVTAMEVIRVVTKDMVNSPMVAIININHTIKAIMDMDIIVDMDIKEDIKKKCVAQAATKQVIHYFNDLSSY